MNDHGSEQTKKLLLFFVAGTVLSLASVLASEARFMFHWMRDVSIVSAAVASPGYWLYTFFISDLGDIQRAPLWVHNVLSSVVNGGVYVGIIYLMSRAGIRSTKMQIVTLVGLLFTFGALFICLWEECYRAEYWK